MQKKLVRAISNAEYNAHSSPLFVQLQLLKLPDLYIFEMSKCMYKYVNGQLPKPLLHIFDQTQTVHAYSTRQSSHLRPRFNRLNTTLQSLLYKGPSIWNCLPDYLKVEPSIKSFIFKLRRHLHED